VTVSQQLRSRRKLITVGNGVFRSVPSFWKPAHDERSFRIAPSCDAGGSLYDALGQSRIGRLSARLATRCSGLRLPRVTRWVEPRTGPTLPRPAAARLLWQSPRPLARRDPACPCRPDFATPCYPGASDHQSLRQSSGRRTHAIGTAAGRCSGKQWSDEDPPSNNYQPVLPTRSKSGLSRVASHTACPVWRCVGAFLGQAKSLEIACRVLTHSAAAPQC